MKPSAENFKKLRIKADLTGTELAEKFGWHGKNSVSRKETGRTPVIKEDILALEQLAEKARKNKLPSPPK